MNLLMNLKYLVENISTTEVIINSVNVRYFTIVLFYIFRVRTLLEF